MGCFLSKRLPQSDHAESSAASTSENLTVAQLEEYCTEENELGRGGYGVVFKGKFTDIKSGQIVDVAIKRVERSKTYTYKNNRRHGNIISLDEEFKNIAAERTGQHDNVLYYLNFQLNPRNFKGSEYW